jgi:dolichyl-phosphate-mannose-protein mannosyltransferase
MWERTRRKQAGMDHPLRGAVREESFALVVSMLLVPFAVYYASYVGYFVRYGWSFTQWANLQNAMFTYHHDLKSTKPNGEPIHPYLSHAWQWILMARPVVYYYKDLGDVRREIIGMGNPAIFWASVVAVPYLSFAWRRIRDWKAGFILVAILAQYLPWLIVPRPQFFFYVTPITPFFVLAVVYGLRRLAAVRVNDRAEDGLTRRARPWIPVVVVYVLVVVAMFVWFWPVLTGWPLSEAAWKLRIWFNGSPWSTFNWV